MQTELVTVKIQLEGSPFVNIDGDFDNGVIAHEYGHWYFYLAGGRNNSRCLDTILIKMGGRLPWTGLLL
jgi:hypothetical protein